VRLLILAKRKFFSQSLQIANLKLKDQERAKKIIQPFETMAFKLLSEKKKLKIRLISIGIIHTKGNQRKL